MLSRNPYVGPRTFQRDEGHLFFGREREARDLIALVSTERLVVFYAQSGAGKSSIVNTRLLPALESREYELLPVGRLSGDTTAGTDIDNIYVYNLIRGLEQHETDPADLTSLTLSEFLAHLNFDEKGFFYDPSPVESVPEGDLSLLGRRGLIIDQFEELFSIYPESWEKREDFFKQLAQAMQDDPLLWVVLVMREDYIASLDAYAHLASNGLRTRYYMQRLEREAALEAVKSPVQEIRPYANGVAEKLIDDLRSIKVQMPDGTPDIQPGQYIEPVQLQVVCYGLWENLPDQGTEITEKDLEEVGDVNESLGRYYDKRVNDVAQAKSVKERLIREWFEKKLITTGGIRNMVLQEREKKSGELDDDVIQALQSDLVRAEKRGGATWYELTHDRLVEPILERNKIWFNENLSPLQRQAALWKDQGQNETWLLSDEALAEVEEWAREHQDDLTDIEKEFLEECHTKQKEKEQRQALEAQQQKMIEQQKSERRRRVITTISIFATLLMAILVIFGFYQSQRANVQAQIAKSANGTAVANSQLAHAAEGTAVANSQLAQAARGTAVANAEEAQKQSKIALSNLLSTQSNALRAKNFQISMLLGIEAFRSGSNIQSLGAILNAAQDNSHLKQYLNGHASNVLAVAFSPDNKMLASASFDKTIILWDVETGLPIGKPLTGHTGAINSISFSPDGNTLASGSSDKTIILWDVKSHQPIGKPLLGHSASVFSVNYGSYQPESKTLTLASGSTDNTIIVWEVSDPLRPRQLAKVNNAAEGGSPVTTLAVSPSGRFLVSGTRTKMRLWALTGHLAGTLPQEKSGSITSVGFSPDSKTLASGNSDGSISLWSVAFDHPMSKLLQWQGHTGPVSSVAFSPDGKTLASGSYDNTVILWDVATSRRIGSPLQGHTGPVSSVAFSPDGNTLASGSYDSTIILWDVQPQASIGHSLAGHADSVLSLAFNPDGKTLASGSADNSIALWNVQTRKLIGQPLQGESGSVLSLAVSPDGKTIASGNEDNNILLWDVATHQPIGMPLVGHAGPVSSVVFSPDGKTLASASADKTIILWDISNPRSLSKLVTLTGHKDAVLSVAFSPDGKTLASGSSDNNVILWDLSEPEGPAQLATLSGHTAEVSTVAFSPDGKTLASGSLDNTVILWDLGILQRIGDPLIGHKGAVNTLIFNPDGKTLASGSADGTIILWDLATRQPIGDPLTGHSAPVLSLAFSPDGKTLATGSVDHSIILWDLDPASWVEKACQRVGRNFTVAEWSQYFPNEEYRATCPQWPLGLEISAAPEENPAMGTPTLPLDAILYGVIKLGSDAPCLNVRAGPGTKYDKIGCIPADAQSIRITGEGVQVNDSTWVPIVYEDVTGWVNSQYLVPQKSEQ